MQKEKCPKTQVEKCGYVGRVVTPSFCNTICNQSAKNEDVSKIKAEVYHPFPSLPQMIKSAAIEVTKHVLVDRRIRTLQEIERIMNICRECEFYTETAGNPRCTKCGCFLNIKRKWESSHCPIGKW